jgi:hypothetical protein
VSLYKLKKGRDICRYIRNETKTKEKREKGRNKERKERMERRKRK